MKWTQYQYFFSESTVFVFTGGGYLHFLVYSKECKIINIPTQARFTFRSIFTLQISASFPWKITVSASASPSIFSIKILTALNPVQCTNHDVTIKITSNQSSWRTYLQFLRSKNVKTLFLYLLRLSLTNWNSVIIFCQMIDIYFLYIKYFMSLHYICSKSS